MNDNDDEKSFAVQIQRQHKLCLLHKQADAALWIRRALMML